MLSAMRCDAMHGVFYPTISTELHTCDRPVSPLCCRGERRKEVGGFDIRLGDRPCDRPKSWPWLTLSFAAVPPNTL